MYQNQHIHQSIHAKPTKCHKFFAFKMMATVGESDPESSQDQSVSPPHVLPARVAASGTPGHWGVHTYGRGGVGSRGCTPAAHAPRFEPVMEPPQAPMTSAKEDKVLPKISTRRRHNAYWMLSGMPGPDPDQTPRSDGAAAGLASSLLVLPALPRFVTRDATPALRCCLHNHCGQPPSVSENESPEDPVTVNSIYKPSWKGQYAILEKTV